MGQILVRQIDDEVLAKLKARAKANARSAEAEIRTILAEAVNPAEDRQTLLSLVGAGRSSNSFNSMEEIVAHVRALRDEGDR